MPEKAWKVAERKIAAFLHAKRRGADFRNRESSGGKNDLICPGYSVEIKHGKRITYGLILEAVAQAEGAKESPDDIPLAILHREGTEYKDCLVVMRLERFVEFFVPDREEHGETKTV